MWTVTFVRLYFYFFMKRHEEIRGLFWSEVQFKLVLCIKTQRTESCGAVTCVALGTLLLVHCALTAFWWWQKWLWVGANNLTRIGKKQNATPFGFFHWIMPPYDESLLLLSAVYIASLGNLCMCCTCNSSSMVDFSCEKRCTSLRCASP